MADDPELDPEELALETLEEPEEPDPEETGGEGDPEGSQQDGGQRAQGGAEGPGVAGRPSRGDARIQSLANENREFKRQLAELQAAQQHRQQPPDPYAAQRAQQIEQERLSLMDPEQRFQYQLEKLQSQQQADMQRLRFEMHDSADQARFDALKSTNKLAAAYAPEVDRIIKQERAEGRNVSREVALKFAIGEKYLAEASKASAKQRVQANGRVATQRTSPTNPGGMQREGRAAGDDLASLERRLKDVPV